MTRMILKYIAELRYQLDMPEEVAILVLMRLSNAPKYQVSCSEELNDRKNSFKHFHPLKGFLHNHLQVKWSIAELWVSRAEFGPDVHRRHM